MAAQGSKHPLYGSSAWKAVRARVLRRDGYRCVMCSADVRGKGASRVDHITEVRHGGAQLDPANLRTLCTRCDGARHAGRGLPDKPAISVSGFPPGWD